MLDIDILTTFVTCGAASCVAALMTRLVRTDDPDLVSALRISSVGFAVLGLLLLQLIGGVPGPASAPMLVAMLGSALGMGVIGWGLSRLAGQRVPPATVAALLAAVTLAQAAVVLVSPWALGVAYSAGITFMCLLTTIGLRSFLRHPRTISESSWAGPWWGAS